MGSRRYIKVQFADGSTKDFTMCDFSDRPWGKEFTDKCKESLLERLNKLGKHAGVPGTDLRHFNGNHATKRGCDPGPKGAHIINEWVE